MNLKIILFILILAIIPISNAYSTLDYVIGTPTSTATPTPSPKTITVDDSGGANYTKIQDAINAASAGDMILVYSGTYYENVNVNKQLTLRGIGMPVVNAMGVGSAITLSVDGITLEGFTAILSGSYPNAGICITSNKNTVIGTKTSNNWNGILLSSSSDNTLSGNNASSNDQYGIQLQSSSNNNSLSGNNASNNFYGFYLSHSSNNTLSRSNVSNNYYGTLLDSSSNNTLNGNNLSNNQYGIHLSSSSNNTLIGNDANNNYGNGIWLSYSSKNVIYNNIFNNTNNFHFSGSNIDTWNTTRQSGTNIIGVSSLGGNYWANPSGTGFSQTCEDVDRDGICDSPYTLDSYNIDYLPLAYNSSTPSPTPTPTPTSTPTPITAWPADMNCNGKIDTGDATLILRDIVGLDIPKCWE